jgi:tRNA(Ile2) C34 agmatinyltransferase TiaS
LEKAYIGGVRSRRQQMSNHCPDCGATLEDFVEGSSMRQRCSSCG